MIEALSHHHYLDNDLNHDLDNDLDNELNHELENDLNRDFDNDLNSDNGLLASGGQWRSCLSNPLAM
jgi:hypothetical protein